MPDWMAETEGMVLKGRIKVPYRWTVGETGSRFFTALRDDKRIWGNKCPECKTVYVPPKKTCGKCFVPTDEWVELKDTGEIQSYTIVRKQTNIHPVEAPFAYANIKLDGATVGLLHIVKSGDLSKIKKGARVRAIFKEQRKGDILDIEYFQPL